MANRPEFRYYFPNSFGTHRFLRWAEAIVAITYVVLISYCENNPGWWLNVNKPFTYGGEYSVQSQHLTIAAYQRLLPPLPLFSLPSYTN